jgi:hypothetical protein
MSDINTIDRSSKKFDKQHSIKTMEILDLTGDGGNNAVITMTGRTAVRTGLQETTQQEIRKATEASPWSNDNLGRAYVEKSLRTSTNRDPAAELRLFVDNLAK